MTSQEMHYDFKVKLNKIDSQVYPNLMVPEIDWTLNEAQNMYIKNLAQPRIPNGKGFEVNKRITEDLKSLVLEVDNLPLVLTSDGISYTCTLPTDYLFYISSYVKLSKDNCINERGEIYVVQHDDRHLINPFTKPSFEWREVNALFTSQGLRLFTDGTFTVDQIILTYLKQPVYIHAAGNFRGGTYTLPGGASFSGYQDCELPDHTHSEIVDLAVLIATGEIQAPDYQIKMNKIQLNNS